MRSIGGNFNCDCGEKFEWKTFFLQPGEAVFGSWDDMQKNVVNKNTINEVYHITIRCPKCKKTKFITRNKEDLL